MRVIIAIFGFFVSALCVFVAVWRIDWHQTIQALSGVRIGWLAIAALFLMLCLIAFAGRWRALVNSQIDLSWKNAFGYLMIGYMTNAVLPMRPGDLLRVALLRAHKVPFSSGLSALLLERLFDVMCVVVMGGILTFFLSLPRSIEVALSIFALAGAVAFIVVGMFIVRPSFAQHLSKIFGNLDWWKPLDLRLHQFINGLGVLRSRHRLMRALFWSVFGWAMFALSMTSVVVSTQIAAPALAGLLVLVVISLGAAIPSSPGAVGVFHALAILALTPWDVPVSQAMAFALIAHGLAISLHISLGFISAWSLGIRNVIGQAKKIGYTGVGLNNSQ